MSKAFAFSRPSGAGSGADQITAWVETRFPPSSSSLIRDRARSWIRSPPPSPAWLVGGSTDDFAAAVRAGATYDVHRCQASPLAPAGPRPRRAPLGLSARDHLNHAPAPRNLRTARQTVRATASVLRTTQVVRQWARG